MADVTLESLAAEVAYLKDAIHELLHRVAAPITAAPPTPVPPPPLDPYGRYPEGPRIVQVAPNVHMQLVAPVCPEFEPGFYAGIFGRDWNPNDDKVPFAGEPSNARPDQPARSASGYPLRYDYNGTWLINADGKFKNEAEIDAERALRASRNAQSKAEWGARQPS